MPLNLGLAPHGANKWFCFQDPELCLTGMWRPTREEIVEWLEKKEIEFVIRENRNPRYDAKRWLHKYIHFDLNEISL